MSKVHPAMVVSVLAAALLVGYLVTAAPPISAGYRGSSAQANPGAYYWRGLFLTPVAKSTAGGLHGSPGMEVRKVAAGSIAARAGLEPGDRILMLDGMRAATPRLLEMAIADHPDGPTVTLEVSRGRPRARLALVVMPPPAAAPAQRAEAETLVAGSELLAPLTMGGTGEG